MRASTETHNIVCSEIQRAWRRFAKTPAEEPHPDFAMVAAIVALNTISNLAKTNLDILDRIEEQ